MHSIARQKLRRKEVTIAAEAATVHGKIPYLNIVTAQLIHRSTHAHRRSVILQCSYTALFRWRPHTA